MESVLKDVEAGLYNRYKVQLQFVDKILGGVPKDPKVLQTWAKFKELEDKKIAELKGAAPVSPSAMEEEEAVESAEDIEKKAWTGFLENSNGLFISSHQVEALFKECANTMKLTVKKKGLKQVLQHGTFVKPVKLYLDRTAPDGFVELAAHVTGRHGPRSILKRHDYVETNEAEGKIASLDLEVWVSKDAELLTEKNLKRIFALGQENGLGCSRSQGYGKFVVTAFEKL